MFPAERSHSYAEQAVYDAIVAHSDLRKPEYRTNSNPVAGMCYVASEALFHLMPNRYKPMHVNVNGVSHWYLIEKNSGAVVDLTYSQFDAVPYEQGRGRGFMTRKPSKRAQVIIDAVNARRTRPELLYRSTCDQHIFAHDGREYLVREWDNSGSFWVLRADRDLTTLDLVSTLEEAVEIIASDRG